MTQRLSKRRSSSDRQATSRSWRAPRSRAPGGTTVAGDLGVWTGSAMTGFAGIPPGGPGTVSGTMHAGDAVAQTAQGDLTTAYNDAAGRTLAPVDVANADLGGRTLAPGLYKSSGTLAITGNLTLDAQGDPNAVFIFQIASSLDTAAGSQVILSGSANAANIYWQVGSSATLGTTSIFKGMILADQSISLATGTTLDGRALARIGAVTLDANAVAIPNTVIGAVTLVSATELIGPYTSASGQSVNTETKTITVPLSGSMQYYRIMSGTALTISAISLSGGNVLITYN
ncbi:MAG TPA: ice-binding family protein [Candidatus Angelobacter sp.]|nr:ice-binding family protein [Candidatus Angelobacter sp.]